MKIIKAFRWLFFAGLLFVCPQLHSITKQEISSRIDGFNTIPPTQLIDSINAFYPQLFIYDQQFGREMVEKLLAVIKDKNPRAHYLCLTIKAAFNPDRSIELIDSSFRYAMEHKLTDVTIDYYNSKSNYFRLKQQYDSSMVYLLKARELAKNDDIENYVHILHQLGDIFYCVNLFDQAENYYLLVDSLKGAPGPWNYWRKIVIRNNLGLIDIQRKNYEPALSKFNESLHEIPSPPVTYSDSLSLAYDKRIIAKIKYETGYYKEAIENLDFTFYFSKLHKLDEHLFPTYLLLIKLYIKTGQLQALYNIYNEMVSEYGNKTLNLEDKIQFILVSAEVNDYLGNYHESLEYYKKCKILSDSLNARLETASIVKLFTEKDFNNLVTNNKLLKTTRLLLLHISILLLVISALLVFRWHKISKLNKLLTETIQTKDKLFSIISHDLKSPFNSLLGLSEVLVDKMKDNDYGQAKLFSEKIYQKSSELYKLIENLLNWSVTQRKKLKLKIEKVPVKPIIIQVVELYKGQAADKKINIEIDEIDEIFVEADPTSLVTLFSNLISNAIKFTPENGSVVIKTIIANQKLEILVSDTGIGIPAKRIAHLFQVSHNDSTPGTNNEKGTGLGLLICKEFAEKNGGSIHVSSQPGKGTTFTVRLNLAKS